MKTLRGNAFGLLVTAASFAAIVALWERLPDPYPTHWNIRGEIDGWTPKPWGPLLLPMTLAFITALFVALEVFASKSVAPFLRAFRLIGAAVVALLGTLFVATTLTALGKPIDVSRVIALALGGMFVVMGNFFGKLTRNPYVGIRTPWTLSNDEVWLRTHRFGGKLFVAAGLASAIGALLGYGLAPMLLAVLFATVASVAYSFFVHRRLARE